MNWSVFKSFNFSTFPNFPALSTSFTYHPGNKFQVVDQESAVLHYEDEETVGLPRNHRDLIRFENAEDDIYCMVYQTIQRRILSALELNTAKGASTCFQCSCALDLRHQRSTENLSPNVYLRPDLV
jgi:hypothetical protein